MKQIPQYTLWEEKIRQDPTVYVIGKQFNHKTGEFEELKGPYHDKKRDLD